MTATFNYDPYYDDFDEDKNFMRVLFRPGYSVQARELTQLQTILANQIEKFGNHIFKSGSPVYGGKVFLDPNANYVKLQTQYNGTDIDANEFLGKTVVSYSGGSIVRAKVVAIDTTGTNPVLVLKYVSGERFLAGDTIRVYRQEIFATLAVTDAVGQSLVATITEGVYYFKGQFVSVSPQTIIIETYYKLGYNSQASGAALNWKIGIEFEEQIIDEIDDVTLLDPAQGAFNYQAPGANRFKITTTLSKRTLNNADTSRFFEIVRLVNGIKTKEIEYPIYSDIEKTLARRTYDESGNYTVDPFVISLEEGDSANGKFNAVLDPGKAYVSGYEFQTIAPTVLEINRARSTLSVQEKPIPLFYESSVVLGNVRNTLDITAFPTLDIHCVDHANVNVVTSVAYNSTKIGTVKASMIRYNDSTDSGNGATYTLTTNLFEPQTANISGTLAGSGHSTTIIAIPATFDNSLPTNAYANMYFRLTTAVGASVAPIPISSSNITHLTLSTALPWVPNSNTFSIDSDFKNTKSLVQTGGSFPSNWIKFAGNIDSDSKISATGDSYISGPSLSSLIFESSYDAIKANTITNCDFIARKLYTPAASDVSGLITVSSVTNQGDIFGWYPTTAATITGSLINQNIVCFVRSGSNTNAASGIYSNSVLALSNSKFTLTPTGNSSFTINVGIKDVLLDLIISTQINNAEATAPGTPYFRTKTLAPSIAGVDLHAKVPFEMGGGDTLENANTVTNTSFTGGVVFEDIGATNFTETAILKDLRTPGKEVSLQVPDVYQIVRITDSKSLTTNVTTAMLTSSGYDVTSSYEFNNGQKKSYYDHSTIRLKRGYSAPTGRIFVQYKYLKHSATTGFFTVDSYIRPSSNVSYSGISVFQNLEDKRILPLRGTFDFRPSKAIGGTSLGYALNPDPFTQIKPNFEYYLGRIDQIVVKSSREFAVINGNPAISPTPPSVKNEDMLIYTLFIPAYTESVKDIRADFHNHRRYTMGDLQAFDDRISGIEYYVSLTTLEKDAASTKILDANLNDRSKYGIVVDNFTSTINQISARGGATDNSNLIENKTLKPASLMRTVKMDFTGSSGASLVKGVGNKKLLMVNYSSTMPLATQPYATKAIAVQTAYIGAFPGKLNLYPEFTAAVDTSVTSKVVLNSSQGLDTAFNFINDSFKYISDKEPTWANDKDSPFSKTADAKYYQTRREAGALSGVVALTGEYYANGLINQDFGQIQAYNDNSYLTAGATFNQKQITTSTTQVDMGNYVTDLAIQPYMKPSRILFSASGLRPATVYFNFFDNVDVNKYIIVPNKITLNTNTTLISGERLLLANTPTNLQTVKTYYDTNKATPGFNTWLEQNSIIAVVSEQNSANISVINETTKPLTGLEAHPYFYGVDSAKYYTRSGNVGTDDHRSGITQSVSSTTIQLAKDAPSVDITGSTITLVHKAGNGSLDMEGVGGQFVISAYNTNTKVATVVLENQFSLYPYVIWNWVYSIGSNKSNKLGQIGGAFYMPLATFRSGERNFRVTESFNNTYDTEALSYADKTFVSSGIQLKKTNLVETVFNTNIETKIVGTVTSDRLLGSRAAGTEIVNRTTTSYAPPPADGGAPAGDGCCGGDGGGDDPLAQTFFVDPQVYPYGTFVDNVDLFFRGKDDENLPVGIHLRPTINSQISGDFFIPDSVVFKYPNEVNVSENPDAANTQTITNFKFSNPVYLKPGMYGLLVYTSSPDYTIWQSEKGKVSTSGQLIDKQPYVGTLYRAQESMALEFSSRINEDLMFKINRCVFDTNQTATFTLTNQQPEKYFGVDKIRLIETSIKPSERENSLVYSIAANTVMGIKETSPRTVLPGVVYGFSTDTLYRVGDRRKKIEYTSDLDLNITLSTSRNDVTPFVSLESLHFNVWENFVDNAELSVNDFIITASGTGYSNSNVVQVISSTGTGANVQIQTNSNGNIVGFLVHSGGTNYIDDYTITIGANTSYPNTAAVGTGAEINSNSEYDPTGGPVQAKYITKPIGLADGYDAGDLRVYLTANKPGETEVTVFYKILSGTDSTPFDDRPYEKLVCINPTSSPSIDEVTYREYEYRPSAILNAITYIGTNGVTYDTFKTFAMKIVMTSTDPAIVPSVKDLRIIAIPAE